LGDGHLAYLVGYQPQWCPADPRLAGDSLLTAEIVLGGLQKQFWWHYRGFHQRHISFWTSLFKFQPAAHINTGGTVALT
jgi:hypothetical protein